MSNVNQLLVYCKRNDQAVFFDVCKHRRCHGPCLYSRVVRAAGTDKLFSPTPIRLVSVEKTVPMLPALKRQWDDLCPRNTATNPESVGASAPISSLIRSPSTVEQTRKEEPIGFGDLGGMMAEAIKRQLSHK